MPVIASGAEAIRVARQFGAPIAEGAIERDRGSLAAAQAKAFGSEVTAEVTSDLFSLGRASTAGERHDLSRHCRNARIRSSHDPVTWKYHHVGNYLLNGVLPPHHGQS